MSGSKPSRGNVREHTSSPSSLRENLQRKLEKIASYGDKKPHPRAEFRGKSRVVPYYESSEGHSSYDRDSAILLYGFKDVDPSWAKPTKRIVDPPVPTRRTGIVGPELDWSVRRRNMPIIFIKQMKERAIPTSPVYQKVFNILFTGRKFEHPSRRPKIGCSPTYHWTDFQVETWTKLANYLGVRYSGETEYQFPRGTVGFAKGGSYYYSREPWPGGRNRGNPLPVFRSSKPKRSELSRILRSLKRVKRVGVKPLDFQTILKVRREKTSREIKSSWDPSKGSFREYKDSIPLILSLNTQRPFPVSQIVLDSLKRIASNTAKLLPGSPWVVDRSDPIKPVYDIKVPIIPTQRVKHRLRAYMSGDGNVYLTRSGMNGIHNLLLKGVSELKIKRALSIASDAQSIIDDFYPQDPPEGTFPSSTLGNWDF